MSNVIPCYGSRNLADKTSIQYTTFSKSSPNEEVSQMWVNTWVNRPGMKIQRSVPFFFAKSANIFVHFRKQKCKSSNLWMTLLISHKCIRWRRRMKCLMTMAQYNYNKGLTTEFKWASFEKRNKLEELINIPTEAEERPMIQISFRTWNLNIKTGTIRNPHHDQFIHDPLWFQNPQICLIYRKNP